MALSFPRSVSEDPFFDWANRLMSPWASGELMSLENNMLAEMSPWARNSARCDLIEVHKDD